jgi:O-antigen ligase
MMPRSTLEKGFWWGVAGIAALAVAHHFLAYFRDPVFLGGLILLEVLVASLWHYEIVYFPLLICFFVWSGTYVPFAYTAMSARWAVLAFGAVAGAILWMRGQCQSFSTLHLAALFASAGAFVSAIESTDPMTALLKASSLLLLFLYCSTGVRIAMRGREANFVSAMLAVCEANVFFSGIAYSVGWRIWGNPNSLGAVMGVVMMPFLLWGFLTVETRNRKYRLIVAMAVCVVLLYVSLSRASILAATVTSVALCVALKRQRLLIQGAFALLLLLAFASVVNPAQFDDFYQTTTNNLLYKAKSRQGVFTSRQTPWQQTVDSLKKHPWFGTGFGTSDMGSKVRVARITATKGIYTFEGTNREHGNSYLEIAEYVGLVGILPFGLLLLVVVQMVLRVFVWMRQTGDARYCGIPLATVLLGGLVHAFFEDWMFAVGYYLCVFFWACAFLLNDILPARQPFHLRAASPAHPPMARQFPGTLAPQR